MERWSDIHAQPPYASEVVDLLAREEFQMLRRERDRQRAFERTRWAAAMRASEHLRWIAGLLVLASVFAGVVLTAAEPLPHDPRSAHLVLDAIEIPRLSLLAAEFTLFHPRDDDRPFDHIDKLDAKKHAGDRERGRALLAQLERTRDVLKRAGY